VVDQAALYGLLAKLRGYYSATAPSPRPRGRPMQRITAQGEALSLSPPSGTRAGSPKTTGLRQAE